MVAAWGCTSFHRKEYTIQSYMQDHLKWDSFYWSHWCHFVWAMLNQTKAVIKETQIKRKYELEPMKKLGNWVKHEKMKVAKMQQGFKFCSWLLGRVVLVSLTKNYDLSPFFCQQISDFSISFNGSGGNVDLGGISDLLGGSGSITVAAWIWILGPKWVPQKISFNNTL